MQCLGPVERLGDTRGLVHAHVPEVGRGRCDLAGERRRHLGRLRLDDGDLAFEVGMLDPVIQRPALQRVVHVTGAVRCDHHERRSLGLEGPKLRNGHRVFAQRFEKKGLELVVGAVDLVDQ